MTNIKEATSKTPEVSGKTTQQKEKSTRARQILYGKASLCWSISS